MSQDHMRAHYQTGSNHMMLNVNLWSTLFLGAGKHFLVAQGAGGEAGRPGLTLVALICTVMEAAEG